MEHQSILAQTFRLIHINNIILRTEGDPNLTIGIIDGPVDSSHPNFSQTKMRSVTNESSCLLKSSVACRHGTFITGVLGSKRETDTPGLVPGCNFVLNPIFCENEVSGNACPEITPRELAQALMNVIQAGAKIVNLSMGLASSAIQSHPDLEESFDYAFRKGVIVVGASGNQGRIGYLPLFNHPWVVPVAMCDHTGRPASGSNMGVSVGKRGLLSPGFEIPGLAAGGGYMTMTGTSIATPFVTGTMALLWSIFPEATAEQIRQAVIMPDIQRRNIVPPLLNADAAREYLTSRNSIGKPGNGRNKPSKMNLNIKLNA